VVEALLRKRINDSLMRSGVTMVDPGTTFVSPDATIGADTVIYPNTYIYGNTVVGRGASLGPGVWIEDSILGKGVKVRLSSYISNSRIGDNVTVGPFAHIRPGAEIMDGAKIGNFVEIKKSRIGSGSKVPHLSYVGDAVIGKDVNIGAGTITCNYDGFRKHETVIGDEVFIGSDTMLVAPLKVGRGATTGAGSTITKDVPEGALAIGRARQMVIENWSRKPREGKGKK
jgi:bifunctional UDP-N-acetylglucosamine pyrophosphorylase/glucosamine-1-phosphate N-acetyltransferase